MDTVCVRVCVYICLYLLVFTTDCVVYLILWSIINVNMFPLFALQSLSFIFYFQCSHFSHIQLGGYIKKGIMENRQLIAIPHTYRFSFCILFIESESKNFDYK